MAFRQHRANELNELSRYCDKVGIKFGTDGSFTRAISLLKDQNHLFSAEGEGSNPSLWGYQIDNLPINITSIPRHTYPSVKNIHLKLSVSFLADYTMWGKMQDSIYRLNMDIMIVGSDKTGINSVSSYHLDKHVDNPANPKTHEMHPLYHIQFGGSKIRKTPEGSGLDIERGKYLYMDPPRLLHYPMDFVLGFDFLLANYFPTAWNNLHRNGQYVSLCKRYQELFWKPYIQTLAKHWQTAPNNDIFADRKSLWPNLL